MAENIHIRKENGKTWVFCPVRKKWLVLTPEEKVRQYMIDRLTRQLHYPVKFLSAEKTLNVHGLKKRYDIVVYNRDLQPIILVECKAPEVKLNDKVLMQIATYNLKMQVPYLVVSNGHQTFNFKTGNGEVEQTGELPAYSE